MPGVLRILTRLSHHSSSAAAVALALATQLLAQAPALAQPVPDVAISPSPQITPLVSEEFTLTLTFQNTAAPGPGNIGYNPHIELLVPPEVTLLGPGVSPIFGNVPQSSAVVDPSGDVTHPVTGEDFSGFTPGATLVVYDLPIGSVAPALPPLVITVDAEVDDALPPGVPIPEPLRAFGAYCLGADPLFNPEVDPFIRNTMTGVTVDPVPDYQGL